MASTSQPEPPSEGTVMDAAVAGAPARAVAGPPCGQKQKSPQNVPPALAEKPAGVPSGEYVLVGLDLETTGRRLVDEIIQIAAYSASGETYTQYIMPYGAPNTGARRRYNIRVVNMGRYRMLEDTATKKVIKSKSEIMAMTDFVDWLESIKPKAQKILLMYHDPRRLYPTLLIQSLIKHRLFERFKMLVAGFTDSYAFCAETYRGTHQSVSLRVLTRLLLQEDDIHVSDTALDRAAAIVHIIRHLANKVYKRNMSTAVDHPEEGAGGEAAALTGPDESRMMACARQFARPVYTEVEAFEALKDLLEKQNSFRSAFSPLLRGPRHERRRLTELRRHLADAGLLYEQVKDAWHEGRRAGLENLFVALEQTLSPEDIQQLVDLFDNHFTPDTPSVSSPSNYGFVYNPNEAYLSSDSDSSGQLSSSISGMSAALFGLEEEIDLILDF